MMQKYLRFDAMPTPWGATVERKCSVCGRWYDASIHDMRRGWGFTCSKSCAARRREARKRRRASRKKASAKK